MSLGDLMLLVNKDPSMALNELIGSPDSAESAGNTVFNYIRLSQKYLAMIHKQMYGSFTAIPLTRNLGLTETTVLSNSAPCIVTGLAFKLTESMEGAGSITCIVESDLGRIEKTFAGQGEYCLFPDYMVRPAQSAPAIWLPFEWITVKANLNGVAALLQGTCELAYTANS